MTSMPQAADFRWALAIAAGVNRGMRAYETDSPLIINADTVLPFPVSF